MSGAQEDAILPASPYRIPFKIRPIILLGLRVEGDQGAVECQAASPAPIPAIPILVVGWVRKGAETAAKRILREMFERYVDKKKELTGRGPSRCGGVKNGGWTSVDPPLYFQAAGAAAHQQGRYSGWAQGACSFLCRGSGGASEKLLNGFK